MCQIIDALKAQISSEFANAQGKDTATFYRYKDGFNFVELYGQKHVHIRVSPKMLTPQQLSNCSVAKHNRPLRATFHISSLSDIDYAMNLIRNSHSYMQSKIPLVTKKTHFVSH